jgi:hypothetical protein
MPAAATDERDTVERNNHNVIVVKVACTFRVGVLECWLLVLIRMKCF